MAPKPTLVNRTYRVNVGSLPVDDIDMGQVIDALNMHLRQKDSTFLLVTPNLTNVAIFHEDTRVQEAYRAASMILADGWPISLAAKWRTRKSLAVVPGSLLLPTWVAQLSQPTRFLVIGGKNGLAISQALYNLNDSIEDVVYDDSLWQADSGSETRLLELMTAVDPDVLLLLLGSPKQEVLAMAAVRAGFKGVILCVGAAGDFMARMPKRAPDPFQKLGLEWLYRITQDPTRLGPRYLKSLRPFLSAVRK